jgi:hypothetical protein
VDGAALVVPIEPYGGLELWDVLEVLEVLEVVEVVEVVEVEVVEVVEVVAIVAIRWGVRDGGQASRFRCQCTPVGELEPTGG